MRGKELLDKMGLINPEYTTAAETARGAEKKKAVICAAAVCVCAAALAAVILPRITGNLKPNVDLPKKETEQYIENRGEQTETAGIGGTAGPDGVRQEEYPDTAYMLSLMNSAGEELHELDAKGGGMTLFNREYMDITYNIAYLGRLYRGEAEIIDPERVTEWVNGSFLKLSVEEQNALPTMYRAVHELGITKEELTLLNDSRKQLGGEMILEDFYIDALFMEEGDMKKQLVNPLALLHGDGTIYTWERILNMSEDELEAAGVDGAELYAYMERVRDYCARQRLVEEHILDRYISEIKNGEGN